MGAPSAVGSASAAPRRRGPGPGRLPRAWAARRDLCWAGVVVVVLVLVDVLLRAYLTRPFWYDEIWRGHFASEPAATFWPELARANTPSAVGWVLLARLSGDVAGWHTWVLRLPGFVALPVLGGALFALTRRFTGRLPAAVGALWLCLNCTVLDLGTQLKPYTVEALAAVVGVWLWIGGPVPARAPVAGPRPVPAREPDPAAGSAAVPRQRTGDDVAALAGGGGWRGWSPGRGRLARRTAAGLVGLWSVPAIFLIAPLAFVEVVRGPSRRRRVVEVLPAVVLTLANTLVFVGHQSSQRLGHYWDTHFLAGRDLGGAVAFVGGHLLDIATGTPPGIDRYDPSLLHPPTDGTALSVWLLAPVTVVAGAAGAALLARRHDGRLLLAALGGAQLAMLAASAVRFWPFGPTRTNLFVVPLLVLLVVTGAADLAGRLAALVVRRPDRSAESVSSTASTAPTRRTTPLGAHLAGAAGAAGAGGAAGAAGAAGGTGAGRSSGAGGPGAGRPRIGPRLARAAPAVVGLVVLLTAGVVGQGASAARWDRLYDHRDRLRGLDLTVDATIATRRLYRTGDLVVVGGRLVRPGWIYAMEESDDGARRPGGLPPWPDAAAPTAGQRGPARPTAGRLIVGSGLVPGRSVGSRPPASALPAASPASASPTSVLAASVSVPAAAASIAAPPRVPRSDTLFFAAPGTGLLPREVADRRPAPRRLLVFVFDLDARAVVPDLAGLRRAGWCAGPGWAFARTGTLRILTRCPS